MARIPVHTIEDAPAAARPLPAEMVQLSPTGRLLNMHAQIAHAPAVLEAAATELDVPASPAHAGEGA